MLREPHLGRQLVALAQFLLVDVLQDEGDGFFVQCSHPRAPRWIMRGPRIIIWIYALGDDQLLASCHDTHESSVAEWLPPPISRAVGRALEVRWGGETGA